MKALLAHPGTQYAHKLACQLHRHQSLYKFVTGIGFSPNDALLRFLPSNVKKKLANRILNCSIPSSAVKRIPLPEIISLRELSRGVNAEDSLFKRNRSFQQKIGQKLLDTSDVVIGFDTSSWILVDRVRKPFVLDQSIAHPEEKKAVFASLRSLYPAWVEDIPLKADAHVSTEQHEHGKASKIVVASSFTMNSLVKHGVDRSKIVVNPYGVGESFFRPRIRKSKGEKVRFVYLGILGARKGLPFLLEAWKENSLWQHAELWLAGPASANAINEVNQTPGVTYKGRLPLNEIPSLLDHCDCLVFPSFFEGFGQVILEAMAAGMSVISTEATAAPDIIENNVDGIVIQAGDKKALGESLKRLSMDVNECYTMGEKAREKARSFSWDAYGDRWNNILAQL